MTRPADPRKPPRREFPTSVRKAAAARSGGICEAHLVPGKYGLPKACERPARDYDHICPDAEGGDPTLDNCAHLCKACHAIKTPMDKRIAAKIARRAGRTGQQKRREAAGGSRIKSAPMPGTKASGLKKRIDGTVERRNENYF